MAFVITLQGTKGLQGPHGPQGPKGPRVSLHECFQCTSVNYQVTILGIPHIPLVYTLGEKIHVAAWRQSLEYPWQFLLTPGSRQYVLSLVGTCERDSKWAWLALILRRVP